MVLGAAAGAIEQGETVVVTYTDPTASNDEDAIQDPAGNDVATFTTGSGTVPAVVNNSTVVAPDTAPPTLTQPSVDTVGRTLVLGFGELLAPASLTTDLFSVTTDGVAVTPFAVAILGIEVNLVFSDGTFQQGETVVVAYTDPTSGDDADAIQDAAGNDAASFTTGVGGVPAVLNNSTVPDTRAPRLTAATVNAAGTQITLTFSENLSTSVPPGVRLQRLHGRRVADDRFRDPADREPEPDRARGYAHHSAGRAGVRHVREAVLREHDPGRRGQRDREFHHRPRRSRGHEQLHPEWRRAAHERGRGPGAGQHDVSFGFLERGDRRGHVRGPLPRGFRPWR